MRWNQEANEAISKVPFFVRKRVKKRVEEEALRSGAQEVNLDHVKACQKRFLERMEDEVKGFQVETCFGPSGCPNRAVACDDISKRVEEGLSRRNLRGFLQDRVKGPLKLHHEFRISISDCPNACSRPQIADLGLIGARSPKVSDEACSLCGACVTICREQAISLGDEGPTVDAARCLACGQCIPACPTGTLQEDVRGYRVLAGGKLGRHPRLGEELPGIHEADDVLEIVERCLDHYQDHCRGGERFGEVLERSGRVELLVKREE